MIPTQNKKYRSYFSGKKVVIPIFFGSDSVENVFPSQLSFSLSLFLSVFLYSSLSLSVSLLFSPSVSLSLYQEKGKRGETYALKSFSLSLCLSMTFSLPLSFFFFLSLCVSQALSVFVTFSPQQIRIVV